MVFFRGVILKYYLACISFIKDAYLIHLSDKLKTLGRCFTAKNIDVFY